MNPNQQALNDEGRDLWNAKAEFWDNLHGDEGNLFHRRLISPAVERLLNLQAGETVLDVACGNGVLARRLAQLGGKVTASDFSADLINLAKKRGQPSGEPIKYHVTDATDESALLALGKGQFDAVVCTMALMDMPVITPLYHAVRHLLKPHGRFVFANSHPAFNSNNPIFYSEFGDNDGKTYQHVGLKLQAYQDIPPVKGAGAPDEPNPHYYYHRTLTRLLGEAFSAGLVLDAIEEPSFSPDDANPQRLLSWVNLWQFSPVIVGRFRVG